MRGPSDLLTNCSVKQLEGLLKEAESQAALRGQLIDQVRLAGQWYQRPERLLDDITTGRVEYRLYGELPDSKKRVVLVQSKSFGNAGQPGEPQ